MKQYPTTPTVNFLSLDLEMNQPSGKIIQVGAVVGNLRTGEIIDDLSVIVNPHETLNPFIIQLTGITPEMVTHGATLTEAYEHLTHMYKSHGCFTNPITWGGGDSLDLKQQLGDSATNWPFGRRWLDVKTIFQFHQLARGQKLQAGLAKALTRVGLAFKGRKHDARDDARNTFLLAHHLLKTRQNQTLLST